MRSISLGRFVIVALLGLLALAACSPAPSSSPQSTPAATPEATEASSSSNPAQLASGRPVFYDSFANW